MDIGSRLGDTQKRFPRPFNLRRVERRGPDDGARQMRRGSVVVITPPGTADAAPKPPPRPIAKYLTPRCVFLHVAAVCGLASCVAFGSWQFRSTASKSTGAGYLFAWTVFGIYIVFMWWKLIHQPPVPYDKDWAIKAREKAEAAGIPLTEIPGWAKDKTLRKAVIAMSRENPGALALPYGAQSQALESFDQKVARIASSTAMVAEHDPIDGQPDAVETPSDDEDDGRIIEARVISSTVIPDEELDEYNRYLFELGQEDAPKRWRKPNEPPSPDE
jgi:hypothetical protein